MMSRILRPTLLIALVALAAMACAGCGDDSDSTSESIIFDPTTYGSSTTPQESTDTTTSRSQSAAYPLTQEQALRLAEAGFTVAGRRPNGLEVLIIESTETVYEEQPIEKEVCGYEYDYAVGEDVYDCDWETVYEERPVQKKVYVVTGLQIARSTYDDAFAAFAEAGTLGAVSSWRRR